MSLRHRFSKSNSDSADQISMRSPAVHVCRYSQNIANNWNVLEHHPCDKIGLSSMKSREYNTTTHGDVIPCNKHHSQISHMDLAPQHL